MRCAAIEVQGVKREADHPQVRQRGLNARTSARRIAHQTDVNMRGIDQAGTDADVAIYLARVDAQGHANGPAPALLRLSSPHQKCHLKNRGAPSATRRSLDADGRAQETATTMAQITVPPSLVGTITTNRKDMEVNIGLTVSRILETAALIVMISVGGMVAAMMVNGARSLVVAGMKRSRITGAMNGVIGVTFSLGRDCQCFTHSERPDPSEHVHGLVH